MDKEQREKLATLKQQSELGHFSVYAKSRKNL